MFPYSVALIGWYWLSRILYFLYLIRIKITSKGFRIKEFTAKPNEDSSKENLKIMEMQTRIWVRLKIPDIIDIVSRWLT